MPDLQDRFLDRENLYLAFKKLKHYLTQNNEWYNPLELSTYEANLATNIYTLKVALESENYNPKPLEILPFPKKNDSNGKQRIRQYFRPHLEDQIVWIAITNVIGYLVEPKIPAWSFGNRLFRRTFIDFDNGSKELKQGSYFNNSYNYYNTWPQSWPRYRRHVALTIKVMGLNKSFEEEKNLEGADKDVFEQDVQEKRYYYLKKEFWPIHKTEKLYWVGLDFEDFFPSISTEIIIRNLKNTLVDEDGKSRNDTKLIINTVERMLKNEVKKPAWFTEKLSLIGLRDDGKFNGIPTGLLTAGFLANLAMLEVDRKVDEYVKKHKSIAIFKYVDDHTILSHSREELLTFLNYYHNILIASGTGVKIKREKIIPSKSFDYTVEKGFENHKNATDNNCSIDIDFPEPLMTLTLEKMSNLNDEDYNLLDKKGLEKSQEDITHLLLADFSDEEIKRDTRMSFAAMKLCQIGANMKPRFDVWEATKSKRSLASYKKEVEEIQIKHKKVHGLLVRAAMENPDKLKLWKRCIEYCFYSSKLNVSVVFKAIKGVDLHPLSLNYLNAYCLMIYNELLFSAIKNITSPYSNYWKQYNSHLFLKQNFDWGKSANSKSFNATNPSFIDETVENYTRFSFFSRRKVVEDAQGIFKIDIRSKPLKFNLERSVERKLFHRYLWFFLSNMHEEQRSLLWDQYISQIDLDEQISWSILSFYPNRIPESIISKLGRFKKKRDLLVERNDFVRDSTGISYEICGNRALSPNKIKKLYPKVYRSQRQEYKGLLKLDAWVELIREQAMTASWIDPRYSEWTHLEIVKQIARRLIKERGRSRRYIFTSKDYIGKIHPSNYLIPKEWGELAKPSWKDWKDKVKKTPIKLKRQSLFIEDHRYLPISKFWKKGATAFFFGTSDDAVVIVGLSVLLAKLLSRNFIWPSFSNKISFIDQLLNEIQNTLETQPISSETRILLSSVFSAKHLDPFQLFFEFDIDGMRKMKNLQDFKSELERIQANLEKGQLDLYNKQPRQLTLIDIDLLNRSKVFI